MIAEPAIAEAKPSLTLKRRLNAAPEKVFAAWADPAKLSRWFGPDAAGVTRAELDLRPGGRFTFGFRTPDGEQHQVGGVYREVVPDEKLVFTWAWHSTPERESLVTVLIKADGGGTILTVTHEQFFDEAARDRHHGGWTASLEKLEAYLAQ
jgi:uncharacterized protein YndB with AHSA1/START domain